MDQAEQLKTEANQLFGQRKYDQAIKKYTEAIQWNPLLPALYSNRAFGHFIFYS
jgi:serine/threonine-protein phosphatase 5